MAWKTQMMFRLETSTCGLVMEGMHSQNVILIVLIVLTVSATTQEFNQFNFGESNYFKALLTKPIMLIDKAALTMGTFCVGLYV